MNTNKNVYRTRKLTLALSALLIMMASTALATPSENAPIWRVQLRVQVADVGDAGTDDGLRVRLNAANSTWLDTGRDDFERNSAYTYDLKLDGLNLISDLDYLYLSKTGSDGLALKSLTLYVNGRAIYTRVFYTPLWLDNEDGHLLYHFVSATTLRADDAWLAYTQPFPPLSISHFEIESRITGMLGDMMHDNRLAWGPKYGRDWVEVTRKAGAVNTLHVDLDLEIEVDNWFNPEVDVDFDVQVRCVNNRVTLTVLNPQVNVDSDWFLEVLSLGLIEFLDDYLSDRLTAGLKGININQNVPVPFCPVIDVDAEGDINFSLPGPIIFTSIQKLQKTTAIIATEAENQAASEPVAAEEAAPLSVNVELADAIKADTETTYTLHLKSNRTVASNATVEIALPSGVSASDATVEVEDAQGRRHIGLQPAIAASGEAVLHFNDRLEPGAEQHYRLRVRLLTGSQAELQLTATVTDEESAASFKSTTRLQLTDGIFKSRGTVQAIKGLATKRADVPSIRKR